LSRPARRLTALAAALAVGVTACGSPSPSNPASAELATPALTPAASSAPASGATDPTAAYLAQLDLAAIVHAAADYAHPVRPSGDPAAAVAAMEAQLRGVDRVAVLKEVFARLTAGIAAGSELATDTAKERAVLAFVQQLSVHDFASPYMALPIFDPLVLFEVHAMDCQKDSRLIADLYSAAGYASRVVDFYGHAVAEVKYADTWHYADADMFGGGDIVTMPDGHIPSVAELSSDPALLDRLPVYLENEVLVTYPGETGKNGAAPVREYPSYAYFSAEYFADHPGYPAYLSRTSFPASAPDPDMTFGWNDPAGLTRTDATDIRLSPIPERPSPGPPAIESVAASRGAIAITVAPSGDATVTGYRVMVGTQSRGWDYGAFLGSSLAAAAWANPGGWSPEMYPRLFRLPPAAANASPRGPSIMVTGLRPGTYFVSVWAVDAYGQRVGRTVYPASNEVRVEVSG
jgi:hypothetical protein